jgi:hypothetical protein
MVKGGKYNFKYQSEKLIYLGYNWGVMATGTNSQRLNLLE